MTRLFAEIKDFKLIRGGEWCAFRIGHAEEFATTIKDLKAIPLEKREWDPEKKLWRVSLEPGTERILRRTFDNFGSSLDAARSQMELFS